MTTPMLPPCPVCGSAPATRIGVSGMEIAMCVNPDCPDEFSGEADQWIYRADMAASRCALAWEMGRDAAAALCEERARQNFEVAERREGQSPDYARLRQGYGEEDMGCAAAIAALTPPADLASGERRAPVSPRQVTEGELDRAMRVFLGDPPQLPTAANYLAMRELMRAALTAALNPQEAPDAE